MRTLLLLTIIGTAPPTAVIAQDAGGILRHASRVYGQLTSLTADFTQVIEDRMIDTLESRGQLFQAGEAQLRMRFSDPEGDLIVSDGEYVWFYLPSTTPGQVIRTPIPSDPVYGPNLLARILDRPDERYRSHLRGSEVVQGRQTDVIELEPLTSDPPFQRAIIWLDQRDALPRRLELHETRNQVRKLELTNLRTNVKIPAGTFRFALPRGVRIVDQ